MREIVIRKISRFLLFLRTSSTALFILSEIFLGTTASIVSFLIFLKLSREIFEKNIADLDHALSLIVYSIRSPFLTEVMFFISFLGNDLIILASISIIILFISKKHKEEAYLFILMVGMGIIINLLMKEIFGRPRPSFSPLSIELFSSFPSGHSMNSFVFYASIAYFIFRFTGDKKLSISVSIIAVIMILLIGFSRVYLGVHYPTDVIAGFIGGFWWFVTALLLEKTILFFRLFHHRNDPLRLKT